MRMNPTRTVSGYGLVWPHAGSIVVAPLLLVALASCGDHKSTTGPTPTTPRLLQQGGWALDPPGEDHAHFAVTTVTDPAAGRWEATVDWTFATNTVWMWVANGACTVEQFALPSCPFEAACPCQFTIRSEVATPKPRVLTIPNAPGGTRTLIIANLGPREESGNYNITLMSSSASSAQKAPEGPAGQEHATVVAAGVKTFRRSR